jgi:hypothetical protein
MGSEVKKKEVLPKVDIKWIALGTLIMIVVVLIFGLLGGILGGFAGILGYLVGGILIGRLSAGVTIWEAGIAGAITVIIGASALLFVGMIPIVAVITASLIGFVIAFLGGWIGEKWQAAAQK